ncbi:MAG: GntR family transcriptional regulator [Betaproteobacteria bacterium]
MSSQSIDVLIPPRPYLREDVYQWLRKHVADLASRNSEPVSLREADLARRLGVSRTPVREALNRLQQEGLLECEPRRGAKVHPPSDEEYLCWLEIREVMEGSAARRAAERASPEAIAELRRLCEVFEDVDPEADPAHYFEANARFHNLILEQSGASILVRLGKAYDYFASGRHRATQHLGRLRHSLDEHRQLVDAIARRDGRLAERLAREHVRNLRDALSAPVKGPSKPKR